MKTSKILLILPLIVVFTACAHKVSTSTPNPPQPLEASARDAVASAKGYLDSAKSKHPECPAASSTQCQIIAKGVAAKDSVIDALSVYCAGPDFAAGGACTPQAAAADKLQSALNGLQTTLADVKGLQ